MIPWPPTIRGAPGGRLIGSDCPPGATMRKRGTRPLKELYDLTDRIAEPEITPVLEGSCRIQGPVDEPDHELQRKNSGMFPVEKRYIFVNENICSRVESGTCNVCSAPCSSCMHLNRTASVMESNVDCAFPRNTFTRKEADGCSFIGVDGLPSRKSRKCDDYQRAASETSNLLSTTSSHDSYSENAESKATLRASVICEASEAVDMPAKVSSSAEVGDNLLPKVSSSEANGTTHSPFSKSHIPSNLDHRNLFNRDEEQLRLECHGDNISCISAVRDANATAVDHNVDLEKKVVGCNSSLISSSLVEGIDDVVQGEAACGSHDHEMEEQQTNSMRPSTCHEEYLQNKITGSNPVNAGISVQPELAESSPSKYIPSPKVQSPCSHPRQGYSYQRNADSKNLQGNSSSQFQVEPSECSMENVVSSLRGQLTAGSVNEQKPTAEPNYEDSKANYMRNDNPSVALKDAKPCLKTEMGMHGEISFDEVMKCSTVSEQFEISNPSMQTSHMQGPEMQTLLNVDDENSESDSGLDDVNICDICGVAGREELLALCSRCSDGAEHTYCMRTKLDKLPVGNWLCEECETKEKIELRKVAKSESASKATCLNENSRKVISSFIPKLLPKLNTKAVDPGARGAIKGPQSPQISSMMHVDNLMDSSVNSKKASEASGGFIGITTPREKTVLSRESSFKNLNMGKVKPVNMGSTFGGQSASNIPAFSRVLPSLGSNSFKGQTQLQSPRVPVSRSNSFNLNSKPLTRVKQLTENVPHKLNPARESISGESRKEGLGRTMTKSASFKSANSDYSNVESVGKKQSLNPSRAEDSSGMKQTKEKTVMGKKNSSVQDHPLVNSSSLASTGIPLSKVDIKVAQHNGKPKNRSESENPRIKNVANDANYIGCKEVKKQLSYQSKSFGSQSSNRVCNSVDQKPSQVLEDGVHANSTATDRSLSKANPVLQCGGTQAEESVLRDDKTKETTLQDDKTKESTLFKSLKQAVSGENQMPRCHRCKETGHATQFCPIDKLSACALKPSAERNLKEGIKKSNKWKDIVEATNLKARLQKTNKLPDKSEKFQRMSADLSFEAASKDNLSSTSSCPGNLSILEGMTDVQEIARSPDADPIKPAVIDVRQQAMHPVDASYVQEIARNLDADPIKPVVIDARQQAMHPVDASYVSTASDSNTILTISDVPGVKYSMQTLLDQDSLFASSLRASAIPELEFIWQGSFEVLRTGRLPELFDGIQAHLSTSASPKVPVVVAKFPCRVQLEEVPRASSWPSQFQGTNPKEDNIGIFFFAKDIESYEKSYNKLLENMLTNDLALRGNIDGVELFIFPSNTLPANSRYWNKLSFLWGVFKGRKIYCLEKIPGSKKKPCGPISVDPLVQDLSFPLINGVPNSQKISSCENQNVELSWCDGSSLVKAVMSTTSVDCRPVSSYGVNDLTHNIEVPPLAGNSSCQMAADSKLPSDCTSLPLSCSLESMKQLSGFPDSCPESRFQLSTNMLCQGDNNAIYLKNSGTDLEGGKIAGTLSHVHANNVKTNFRPLPANTDFSNCRQGSEDSSSEEKMIEKEKPSRYEAPLEDPRENSAGIDLSWGSPSRKRAHSLSASKSTAETNQDGREHKKVKRCGEGHASSSCRDENSSSRSSSKVHPLLGSLLNEQQHRDGVSEAAVMTGSSRDAEMCFFPVDSGPLRDTRLDNVINLSSDNECSPESSAPFLELALGGKKKWGKERELPLLFPLTHGNGSQDRMFGSAVEDNEQKVLPLLFPLDKNGSQGRPPVHEVDDDASLSLSLGFPSTHTKPVLKTEQLMPDEPHVNTSLLLFSGFPHT